MESGNLDQQLKELAGNSENLSDSQRLQSLFDIMTGGLIIPLAPSPGGRSTKNRF